MSAPQRAHVDVTTDQTSDKPLRAVIRTQSGSTYRLEGDRLVLDGPTERAYDEFTLISLDGGRLIYTDGTNTFRSSQIVAMSSV